MFSESFSMLSRSIKGVISWDSIRFVVGEVDFGIGSCYGVVIGFLFFWYGESISLFYIDLEVDLFSIFIIIILLLYSLFKSFSAPRESLFIISNIFNNFIIFLIFILRRALSSKSDG